jgi:4-diphosphocytidyl-2-C-methyl-D-erythritol kinase
MECFSLDSISLKVPAKINLALNIAEERDDGYHFMKMVMQAIDLFDYITIEKNESKAITIECDNPNIPCNSSNTCYKAAELFFKKNDMETQGIHIKIEKNIPVQAGLGGGSADAAGVLVGLNVMFEKFLSNASLCNMGVMVGADVPFCIIGGTATAEGIGEIILPLPNFPEGYFVVCKQKVGVSTKEAFAKYDEEVMANNFDFSKAVAAVVSSDIELISEELFNAFEEFIELEDTSKIKEIMSEHECLGSLMSGSGSAIFGIFDSKKKAIKCANELKHNFEETFVCVPYEGGATII